MNLVAIESLEKEKIVDFFTQQWGSPEMAISSGVYDCSTLDGFVVLNDEGQIAGLITYVFRFNECEIISLDSIEEKKGIGSALLQEVERVALANGCSLIKLITTNDNLLALKFYQKRGYNLSNIFLNAVDKAREIKPSIPLRGNDGIPIRDELELTKMLLKPSISLDHKTAVSESLENDKLKGVYLIWGLILFFELGWLWLLTQSVHTIADLSFVISVIGVTCVFGAVGFALFKEK